MKLLLDTHILICALSGSSKLSQRAKEYILNPDNTIYFSVVSLWEIVIKHSLHPSEMAYTGWDFYTICQKSGFLILPATAEHVLTVESLHRPADAPAHKDPFDKLLISQAKTEGMLFLTSDSLLGGYQEECVTVL